MSSTYEWYDKPKRRIMSETGLVYKQYRLGPSTEPWGTPNVSFFVSDRTPFMLTHWVLSDKYDLNQAWTSPLIPYMSWRQDSKIWWSMVSNAAERSNNSKTTLCYHLSKRWESSLREDCNGSIVLPIVLPLCPIVLFVSLNSYLLLPSCCLILE